MEMMGAPLFVFVGLHPLAYNVLKLQAAGVAFPSWRSAIGPSIIFLKSDRCPALNTRGTFLFLLPTAAPDGHSSSNGVCCEFIRRYTQHTQIHHQTTNRPTACNQPKLPGENQRREEWSRGGFASASSSSFELCRTAPKWLHSVREINCRRRPFSPLSLSLCFTALLEFNRGRLRAARRARKFSTSCGFQVSQDRGLCHYIHDEQQADLISTPTAAAKKEKEDAANRFPHTLIFKLQCATCDEHKKTFRPIFKWNNNNKNN